MPEESVLIAVLFLMYITNVSYISGKKHFAGDLKIYRPLHGPAYDFHILQRNLDEFGKCSELRQLNVCHEKCHVHDIKQTAEMFSLVRT